MLILLWERRLVAICFGDDFNFTGRDRSRTIENGELN